MAGGTPPYCAQWFVVKGKSALKEVGAGGMALTIAAFDTEDVGTYHCEVTDSLGDSAVSNPVQLMCGAPKAGLPVSGVLGLALIAASCALSGAMVLHRRDERKQ